ncbi:hypothetical protein B9Z55_007754 [Caenorhabditis nigoni]|uniref:F-box domain-containing protein n=1 Tax=Caenorhabditis nigoni TaxID=1611254 RepID=A0A2G5VB52_9PELO|nr:hypothetical protein B9Z55_007754 [Caenorhabditis nigoni]
MTEKDKNWCDMPAEVKLECIRNMELKERLSLRCTAKAENSLVDSQTMHFENFEISFYMGMPQFKLVENTEKIVTSRSIAFMQYILKIGIFENMKFFSENMNRENKGFVGFTGKISAKNISFTDSLMGIEKKDVLDVLERLGNGVESIKLDGNLGIHFALDDILAISHVQNARYCHFKFIHQPDTVWKIAKMWTENNSKIGSTVLVSTSVDGSFDEFHTHFADFIVSETSRRIRVRTNNPDHHILLERGSDEFLDEHFNPQFQFFRLMVISAEMKESEYDDNCKEWICMMHPDIFDEYDFDGDDDDDWD